MKNYIVRRKSNKNRRVSLLHFRTVKHNGSSHKSLNLFVYNAPRNASEREHNREIGKKCDDILFEAQVKQIEGKDSPLAFHWLNEVVPDRLRLPMKRILIFLDSEISEMTIEQVADIKYLHSLKELFQKEIEEKKFRGKSGHQGKGKKVLKAATYCSYWASFKAAINFT